MRKFISGLLVCLAGATSVQSQTADTSFTRRPLFTAGDAAIAGGFALAAIVAAPADRYFTRELQDEARQANHELNRTATVFRLLGHPGGLFLGSGIYLGGLAADDRRTQDLGLHTVESILISSTIVTSIKIVAGRARPRVSPDRARNFQLFRGWRNDEYQSFPSGHSSAAFAFAAIMSSETSHSWPESRWIIGPIVYGGAAFTGVSRIYNNAHWASDVLAGGAIGTLTGLKVYRYQHSHPGNKLDKTFLRAGVQLSNAGFISPILSMVKQ